MTSKEILREKYGYSAIRHDPDPECRHCKGEGERYIVSIDQWTFCACVFFVKEDMWIAERLDTFAKQELKRLKGEE